MLFIITIINSCQSNSDNNLNYLVARAGENFLYKNDLPFFLSSEDSLRNINSYIESWAREKLLFDLSLINLSQTSKNQIDELIENYKVELYINSFKELLVNNSIDSIVNFRQVDSFYKKNYNNFKLSENLLKFRNIKVPADNVNISKIRRSILRINESDRYFLDSLSYQFADINLNDTIWFTERELISSIDFINQQNKNEYFIEKKLFMVEKDNYINFFIIKDILKSGNIPPMSYLYERIESTLINQRKLELIQNLNNEIINDALRSKKFQIFK